MRKTGLFHGTLASLLIGTLIVVNKMVLNVHVEPLVFITATYVVAAILSLPFLWKEKRSLIALPKTIVLRLVALGLIATGVAPLVQILGQRSTSAVNVSFLATLSAIFTILFSSLLLKEGVFKKNYLFALPLFVGIYFLLVGFQTVAPTVGDALIVLGALFFGFSNSFARTIMDHASETIVAYAQMAVGAFFLVFLLFFFGPPLSPQILGYVPWYLAAGTMTWLITVILYKGFRLAGTVMTMFVTLSYPLVATIGSLLFLKEPISVPQVLGGLLILWSIYNIVRGQRDSLNK